LSDPKPPTGRTASELEAWSESTFARWLEHKHRSVDAARRQLDIAAAQSLEQQIMAGALVGLVYEDVVRVMLELPIPSELDREPEIAALYRELLDEQAEPFVVQARLAYEACSVNASQISDMQHWAEFCGVRGERLPAVQDDAGEAAAKGPRGDAAF
jgi:hypothetical protein